MPWTTADLLTAVRRRAQLPASSADGLLTDTDLLALATEEIDTLLVPLVRAAREEYWVTRTDLAITAGTAEYRIPTRAQASALRDVTLVVDGAETSLPHIELEERGRYTEGGSYWWDGAGVGFALQGDKVVVLPTPTKAATLRLYYARRLNRLVATSAAALVSSVAGTPTITFASVPATWSDSDTFDAIEGTPSFDWLGADLTASNVVTGASGTITFDSVSSELAAGDYVALAGETPVPQIPAELHPLLISATVARALEVVGDRAAFAAATQAVVRQSAQASQLLEPRVEGAARRVVNWHSPLRSRRRRWQ